MRKLLLFFLLFGHFLVAQIPNSLDSLKVYLDTKPKDTSYVLALNSYAFLNVQEGKYEEAARIIQEMERLSKKLDFGTGFYKSMNMKGVIAYSKQNPEKAMEYFIQCNTIIKKYKLPKKIYQNSLNNIGIIYNQLGDREKATKYALELISFQEKNKLSPLKSSPYTQVGDNLKFYKKFDEALLYFQKALIVEINLKDDSGIAINENRIGTVYEDLKKNQKAIDHFKKGLTHAERANYKLLQVDLLTNLGRMFQKEKNFIAAENMLKKAEKYSIDLEATQNTKVIYSNLGDLYFEQKNIALAEDYYIKALQLSKEINDQSFLFSANENLATLYEKKGDFRKAYFYKTEANVARDSIFKLKTLENTEDLLRKYQTEKKEQEIALKNVQISNAKKQKWYFISGLFLLAIIGSLLFYQSRNRKKTNEKLQLLNDELDQANKAKTRFFSILNHDLRAPVANLVNFLQLQKESPELLDDESTKRMQEKTMSGAENLLNSMEDILQWSKSQMENFKPELKQIAVSSLFSDIQNHFSSFENIEICFENEENITLKTDEHYLKTILRNLTGNAIKAFGSSTTLSKPVILWKAWQHNNQTFLSITDNGKGADLEQFKALYDDKEVVGIKSGLGLHLIRDMAKVIDCEIFVESKKDVGSTFTLFFRA